MRCWRNVNGVTEDVGRCSNYDLVDVGTKVSIVCVDGYRQATMHEQVVECRNDGWSQQITPCTPISGDGGITRDPIAPWHVAVYRSEISGSSQEPTFICGGTILNSKVILSAAHCFWNTFSDRIRLAEEFQIVAGNSYRRFNDLREENSVQVHAVKEIHYPETYTDRQGLFADDIAMVILQKYIEFTPFIAPASIDFNEGRIDATGVGQVAGWDLTSSNEKLRLREVAVIERSACRKVLPLDYRPFLSSDKFCAGGLYEGDAGSGLVYTNNSGFYLRGIMSVFDNEKFKLYTNVTKFFDFIRRHGRIMPPERSPMDRMPDVAVEPQGMCISENLNAFSILTPFIIILQTNASYLECLAVVA